MKKKIALLIAYVLVFASLSTSSSYAKTLSQKDLDITWLRYQVVKEEDKDVDLQYHNSLLRVFNSGRYGYVDKTGKMIIPFQYEDAKDFSEGLAAAKKIFSKYAYINSKGDVIIPAQFTKAGNFSEGLAYASVFDGRGKYGYINKKGERVIPFNYTFAGDFNEGFANVKDKYSKAMFLRRDGSELKEFNYAQVFPFSEGLAAYQKNQKGYLNSQGKQVIGPKYKYAKEFSEGLAAVRTFSGNYGFINKQGKIMIPEIYSDANSFHAGVASVQKDKEWGFVDVDGNEVATFQFAHKLGDISEGLALIEKSGKYGYVNRKNEMVIPTIFDKAYDFSEGVAVIKKGGRYGVLKKPIMKVDAMATTSKLKVDGKSIGNIEVYLIDGHNYFKLRDIAKLANNTKSKFSVSWNEKTSLVSLNKGQAYKALGTELKGGNGKNKIGMVSPSRVEINGKEKALDAYLINEENYYQIRPLGAALGFDVEWDSASGTVLIDMNR